MPQIISKPLLGEEVQQSNRRGEAVTYGRVQLLWELVESESWMNLIGQADDTFPPVAAALALKNPKRCPLRDQPARLLYFHLLQQTSPALPLAPDGFDRFEPDNELAGRLHVFLIAFSLPFIF